MNLRSPEAIACSCVCAVTNLTVDEYRTLATDECLDLTSIEALELSFELERLLKRPIATEDLITVSTIDELVLWIANHLSTVA